jgi:hypothetical protein
MTRQQSRWVSRKGYGSTTKLQQNIHEVRAKGGDEALAYALGNFSRNPKGQKRARAPQFAIWPAGRVARPGRMA